MSTQAHPGCCQLGCCHRSPHTVMSAKHAMLSTSRDTNDIASPRHPCSSMHDNAEVTWPFVQVERTPASILSTTAPSSSATSRSRIVATHRLPQSIRRSAEDERRGCRRKRQRQARVERRRSVKHEVSKQKATGHEMRGEPTRNRTHNK